MHPDHEILLDGDEKYLADAICWDLAELNKRDYSKRMEVFEKMGLLTESLLERSAVPKHRVEYLTSPAMFIGGYGKSRIEMFERNGTAGHEIFRHPDFMKYLSYFIHGPDLPLDTITEFRRILEEDAGTSGEILDQITSFVRKEIREKRLNKYKAAEEFFRLCYEVGSPRLAEATRLAAMSVR